MTRTAPNLPRQITDRMMDAFEALANEATMTMSVEELFDDTMNEGGPPWLELFNRLGAERIEKLMAPLAEAHAEHVSYYSDDLPYGSNV